MVAISALATINFYNFGYLVDKTHFFGGTAMFLSILAGLVIGGIVVDRIERKFVVMTVLFCTSPAFCLLGMLFHESIYTIIPITIFSLNAIIIVVLAVMILTLLIRYTKILERGRIIALIASIDGLLTLLILYFVVNGYLAIIPMIIPILTGAMLYKYRKKEKTLIHFDLTLIDNEDGNAPNYEKLRDKWHLRTAFREFISYLFNNSHLLKYFAVLFACGMIVGLLIPASEFAQSLIVDNQDRELDMLIFVPIFLAIGAFLVGLIFDFYGRKTTISLIVYFVGIVNFTNILQANQLIDDKSLAVLISLVFTIFLAIPLLNGDLGKAEFYGRITVLFIGSVLIGLIVGILLKDLLIFNLISQNPFIQDTVLEDASELEGILFFNYSVSSLVFLLCLTALFILTNIRADTSTKELSWPDSLIHLYIIHNSGLLLYEHEFKEQKDVAASDLVSGGLIGLVSILKEITKGKQALRIIDHGDKKLLFQWGSQEKVVFVLVIERELIVLRHKLSSFADAFVERFSRELKHFSGVDDSLWKPCIELIQLYFTRKYMNWLPALKNLLEL